MEVHMKAIRFALGSFLFMALNANAGGTLYVENCIVSGFPSGGISFQGPGKLEVKDCTMSGNGIGIIVEPSTGTALAVIEQIRLEGNTGEGLHCADGSQVTIRNAIVSGSANARSRNGLPVQLNVDRCVTSNNNTGIRASGDSAASVEINVESCTVSSNSGAGVFAQGTSTGVTTIRISNSLVTDNMIGLASGASPAAVLSRGNNTVEGNGTDTSGTIGSYTAK
jgi:hypothetical protein